MMKEQTYTLHYYALVKDEVGTSQEEIVTKAKTPSEVYSELKERYSLTLNEENMRIAVNDEYVDWSFHLKNNDHVIFVPPVSGG